MKKTLLLLSLFALLTTACKKSYATFSGTGSVRMGADAAKEGFTQLLLAPPFPDLDGGKLTLTPLAGIVKVAADNSLAEQSDFLNPGNTFRHSGEVNGNNAGLGVTVPTTTDFGSFGFVVGSKLKGSHKHSNNCAVIETMDDI